MLKENLTDITPIYRYMDMPELIALLFKEELCFSTANILNDKNEISNDSIFNVLKFLYESVYKDRSNNPQISDEAINFINKIKCNSYITSWSTSEDNVALWKIYSKNNPFGFCVESTVLDLFESLNLERDYKVYRNLVEYDIPHSIEKIDEFIAVLNKKDVDKILQFSAFLKIPSYSYEQEYRIVIYRRDYTQSRILVKADMNKLIKHIYISPFMPKWFTEIIIDIPNIFPKTNPEENSELIRKISHLKKLELCSMIKE